MPKRYDFKKLEAKWRKQWLEEGVYEPNLKGTTKPFYNLMMFPYLSAEGLHIGSVRTFTGIDIYGRLKRMQGNDVFQPIGLDGFGIHSENHALKTNTHPVDHAVRTEKNFYRQLGMIGNGFAWKEKLETYDPAYYKWTQWIFTELFRHGLAYRKKQPVNWCPSCKTVLADEQVLSGKCERCASEVVKRDLEQWFLKITDYAERLLRNIENLEWSDMVRVAQRNWIGKSEGAEVSFKVVSGKSKVKNCLVIHGISGHKRENWFPWFAGALKKHGWTVHIPTLPGGDHPVPEEWSRVLKKEIRAGGVVVGHSLGVPAALQALVASGKKIEKLICVAPVNPNLEWKRLRAAFPDTDWTAIRSFADTPIDWKKVSRLVKQVVVYYSDNDKYISASSVEFFRTKFPGAVFRLLPGKGHFSTNTGVTELPEILNEFEPRIKVFTTRADTIFGVSYLVVAPEHPLLMEHGAWSMNHKEVRNYIGKARAKKEEERTGEGSEKTGVELKGIRAINPATGKEIPIWVADYVLGGYGTGAVMAVPAHDPRDWEFAKNYKLPVPQVVMPVFGKDRKKAVERQTVSAWVRRKSDGKFLALHMPAFGWITPVIGGIERGENPATAAEREVLEETGYKAKTVRVLDNVMQSNFFADHKNEWRRRFDRHVLLELKDENPRPVSPQESAQHAPLWLTPEEAMQKITYANNRLGLATILSGNDAYGGEGVLVNSGFLNGLSVEAAKKKATAWLKKEGLAKPHTQYRLRDWLLSRQRYWGPPIPMIYCETCAKEGRGERKEMPGWYAVPVKDLPVKLPRVKDFRPKGSGKSPLATVKSFYEAKCPACKSQARRETDVSDTFLDSAWYFLRYPSVQVKHPKLGIRNSTLEIPWDPEITRRWLPVHSYIGGAEHSVLHLLYARFITMAFHDFGYLGFEEPFARFRAHGLITKDGAKMSKSKGNVVNPDDYFGRFGADVMRMYLAFLAPLEQGGDFRDEGIAGTERFLERVWRLYARRVRAENIPGESGSAVRVPESFRRLLHQTIKKVGEDTEDLKFNTAISSLMVLLNAAEEAEKNGSLPREFFEAFPLLLAPFAPFVAEELWRGTLGRRSSVHRERWPVYVPELLEAETFTLIIQVNGKVRDSVEAHANISEAQARELALSSAKIKNLLGAAEPRRMIYVPKRLINIVV